MNKPSHKVFNLIVLDESGSMQEIAVPTLSGFNEIVQTIQAAQQQFPQQQHTVTWVSFNGIEIKKHLENVPVSQLQQLDASSYRPMSMTPLYDALGRSLLRMEWLTEKESDYTVLVSILTDGYENASKEFSGPAIRAMIERLKGKEWSFTYMGANHDVKGFADSLSIKQSVVFESNQDSVKTLFEKEKKGRMAFYQKRSRGMSTEQSEEGFWDQK